ncbi:unnamed protein product [Phytomonas sp. EM1]|nr:unnamed protein product [Phytomonas sp. EM1]|eukprot:CCW63743.1 unnamed protein product [Phytomonas sp. isolate EM1]
MEILKTLSEAELDNLRSVFNSTNSRRALNESEFKNAVYRAIQDKSINVSHVYLTKLFASIDVAGSGYVSWDELTTFAIEQASGLIVDSCTVNGSVASMTTNPRRSSVRSRSKRTESQESGIRSTGKKSFLEITPSMHTGTRSEDTAREDWISATECVSLNNESICSSGLGSSGIQNGDSFDTFRPFHIDQDFSQPYGWEVVSLRFIKSIQKLVKLSHDSKGKSVISIYDVKRDEQLNFYAGVLMPNETVLDWDYIPSSPSCIYSSNALACSYNGGLLRLFTLEKRRFANDTLKLLKMLDVHESKTNVRWCSAYDGRLAMGNRHGVVGLWDIESEVLTAERRIHDHDITALRPHGTKLYSASLDRTNSVKFTDLERLEIRTSFNDHGLSGALCLEVDEEYLFSAGFENKIVQRPVQCPKSHPTFLYDSFQPHECYITCIRRLEDGPYLISADAKGCIKIWDLRIAGVVQTISMQQAVRQNERQLMSREDSSVLGTVRRMTCKVPDPIHGFHRESKRERLTHEAREWHHCGNAKKSTTGFGSSSTHRKPPKSVLSIMDNRMSINTLCPFVASSFFVAMPRKLYLLGSAETTCPDLVDDKVSCRFLLIPDPSMVLTIHERSAKLWQISNGHLVYATGNNLLENDITACVLVEPLRRQFLLGSMTGELLSFSVSLGQCTHSLTTILEEAGRGGKEILSLHTLPRYRDHLCPYAIVSYADGVVLVALAKDYEAQNVVRLSILNKLLATSGEASAVSGRPICNATIRDTKLMGNKLFVCDSNAYVYVVNLTKSQSTFTLKLPLLGPELIFLSPFLELPNFKSEIANDTKSEADLGSLCDPLHARSQPTPGTAMGDLVKLVFMVTNSTGTIVVGQSAPKPKYLYESKWNSGSLDFSATLTQAQDYEVTAEWRPFAERMGEEPMWRWCGLLNPDSRGAGISLFSSDVGIPFLRASSSSSTPEMPPGKGLLPPLVSYLPVSRATTVGVIVLHIVWLNPDGVVALADNYGYVHIWDLMDVLFRPVIDHPPSVTKSRKQRNAEGGGGAAHRGSIPHEITYWHAHKNRITAMKCTTVCCPLEGGGRGGGGEGGGSRGGPPVAHHERP